MKILSLSGVYPNPAEPGLGLFVRSRLQQIACAAEVKVIAPMGLLDYSNPERRLLQSRGFPSRRWDGNIEVLHPRWLYPPYGTAANALCLFSRLLPMARSLRSRFPFDLIDAHFCHPEGIAAALLAASCRAPFTITLRGSEMVFARHRGRRRAISWALRRAGRVIAVSDELARFAAGMGAAPARIVTIPNGLDTDLFFPRDRVEMRAKHGLRPDRKVILSAGELIEAKGHHIAIRSLGMLVKRGFNAELLIVGGVARGGVCYEPRLRSLTASLGLADRVRFTGWVDRAVLAELLSAADLFCLASFTEGCPNVVREALGCGAPVVATRVGAIPSLVPSDSYGLLTPVNDAEALSAAFERALSKHWQREAISAWGRSRSWKQVAAEVLGVFQTVTGQRDVRD